MRRPLGFLEVGQQVKAARGRVGERVELGGQRPGLVARQRHENRFGQRERLQRAEVGWRGFVFPSAAVAAEVAPTLPSSPNAHESGLGLRTAAVRASAPTDASLLPIELRLLWLAWQRRRAPPDAGGSCDTRWDDRQVGGPGATACGDGHGGERRPDGHQIETGRRGGAGMAHPGRPTNGGRSSERRSLAIALSGGQIRSHTLVPERDAHAVDQPASVERECR